MPEMPRASEGHGQIPFIRRRDDFCVAHRTSRLNRSRRTRFRRRNQTIRKWEKRVAANHTALQRELGLARLQTAIRLASTRLICPAPMPSVRSAAV